jgi:hypothetical protein
MERVPVPPWLEEASYVDAPLQPGALSLEIHPPIDPTEEERLATDKCGEETSNLGQAQRETPEETSTQGPSTPFSSVFCQVESPGDAYNMRPLEEAVADIEHSFNNLLHACPPQASPVLNLDVTDDEERHELHGKERSQVSTKHLGVFVLGN